MSEHDPKIDLPSALVRGALSSLPGVGPVLAELLGQVIPDRRIERLTGLFERLEQRVANLEPGVLRDRFTDPMFPDLLEDAMFNAVRASSRERLDYIAEIVARGLNHNDLARVDRRYLLSLLAELNDIEVLVLCQFALAHQPTERAAFVSRHREALEIERLSMAETDRERITRAHVRESYREHLERVGLLTRRFTLRRGEVPEFERNGRPKGGHLEVSALGRILAEEIGGVAKGARVGSTPAE